MNEFSGDAAIRASAFTWLTAQVRAHGDVLPRSLLAQGFVFDGQRVPLVGPQGIFKPRLLELPLTITTTPSSPYDDGFGEDGLLHYRYRGTDSDHPDNRGLRLAMKRRTPLAYFHGVVAGKYLVAWPAFVVRDDPSNLTFTVAVDDVSAAREDELTGTADSVVREDADEGRREYVTRVLRQRLHQRRFREKVIRAYREQCALCRLRHEELLDAAHIIPDPEPLGEPHVRNGLALCKLHHAAFDSHFLGVRPDYRVEIRSDLLKEVDGPTLVYALQKLDGTEIFVPRDAELRPEKGLLELRYQRFRAARPAEAS